MTNITRLNYIDPKKFVAQSFNLWKNQWMLLTAGNYQNGKYNTMTVAWGALGIMWNKPFAMVVVRPSRYTFEFMNNFPDFTLSAFPKSFKKDLSFLGKNSGRDMDKISQTNLHPVKSEIVASPSFQEAELIIECKKNYWNDLQPENFIDPAIAENFENKDAHRIYFGEILLIKGDSGYYKK